MGEEKKTCGTVFDIVRNSFADGPGIRTTVFFKGCNLHCLWCHNPESQSSKPQMLFYKSKCTGCGKCREVCLYGLESCDLCGKCALYCPSDARQICGKKMTAQEVFDQVIKDKCFYEASGGGVTFSGGECMLQIEFLLEILKKCHENGIHTAVDTAGAVGWEHFEKILPYTDLFLYDVKLFDGEKHRACTGADNARILENLRRLSDAGKDIIVRIPVIGGVNDNEMELQNIADYLKPLHIRKVELLPYHKMGEHKYFALGLETKAFAVPSESQMALFNSYFHIE